MNIDKIKEEMIGKHNEQIRFLKEKIKEIDKCDTEYELLETIKKHSLESTERLKRKFDLNNKL